MDDDENQDGFYAVAVPVWRFSPWDVAGIALHTTMGVLTALGNGAGLLARECSAAANKARQDHDLRLAMKAHREAQQAIGADIAALVAPDTPQEEA